MDIYFEDSHTQGLVRSSLTLMLFLNTFQSEMEK